MPWNKDGSRKTTHYKKSGFKMAGWSAFTKAEEPKADMPEVKVTPEMEKRRNIKNKLIKGGKTMTELLLNPLYPKKKIFKNN